MDQFRGLRQSTGFLLLLLDETMGAGQTAAHAIETLTDYEPTFDKFA
jgi:hypothetical protein